VGKDFDSAAAMPGRELVAAVAAEVVNVLERSHEEGNAAEVRWDAADTGSPRKSGVATVVLDAGQLTCSALGTVDWRGVHADGQEGSGGVVIDWGRHTAIAWVGLLWDGLFIHGASVLLLGLYVHGGGLYVLALVKLRVGIGLRKSRLLLLIRRDCAFDVRHSNG